MYSDRMTDEESETQKLIAHFMSVSAPLERYLQEGRPLTALQLESISLAVDGHRIVAKESKRCRTPHNLMPFLWRSTPLV